MPDEPESLGDRLRAIEQRLEELEISNLVDWGIWERLTLPTLAMLAATPAHRPELLRMVEAAEAWTDLMLVPEDRHPFRRRFALLRTYLLDPSGPDLSL